MLRMMVSEARSGAPSPPPATSWVRTRSTRSPGKTKPATPLVAETATVTARMPGPERRGEEAALAGTDDGALGERLAGGDLVADDGADQALRIDAAFAAREIGGLDQALAARAGSGRLRRR